MNKSEKANAVSTGVLLIGIGMLILTGWWWPGIMLVLGLSGATRLLIRGMFRQAIWTFALFILIPIGIAIMQSIHVPWHVVIPLVLIGMGAMYILKGLVKG
ncbi:MAG: hypothetical protein B6242_14830 [Anaerolineaceae bacterium 4572_78]|nr:MAG: hypothetical protein B6242_14830 [Anaerolineaceae bacterium 4572_78]